MNEDLDVVVGGIEHDGLVEEVEVLTIWIPSHFSLLDSTIK